MILSNSRRMIRQGEIVDSLGFESVCTFASRDRTFLRSTLRSLQKKPRVLLEREESSMSTVMFAVTKYL